MMVAMLLMMVEIVLLMVTMMEVNVLVIVAMMLLIVVMVVVFVVMVLMMVAMVLIIPHLWPALFPVDGDCIIPPLSHFAGSTTIRDFQLKIQFLPFPFLFVLISCT